MTGNSCDPIHGAHHHSNSIQEEQYRVFKLCLNPTTTQRLDFQNELRAAKWAYNSYVKHWYTCRHNWFARREQLIDNGLGKPKANAQMKEEARTNPALKHLPWTAFDTQVVTAVRNRHKEAERLQNMLETPLSPSRYEQIYAEYEALLALAAAGKRPWAHRVHRRSLTSGLKHANAAVQNYERNFTADYTGPRFNKPRFKKRLSEQSVVMDGETIGAYGAYHYRKTNQITNYHRVRLGKFESVRVFNSTKPLTRALQRGGKARSFTLITTGGRWYASILVKFDTPQTQPTSRKQRDNHSIGLDFGIRKWLACSDENCILLPEYLQVEEKKLVRLQRKISRAQPGSNRHRKLCGIFTKKKHKQALRRKSFIDEVTKALTTSFKYIGIEDLDVKGMTASVRGTVENPGTGVRAQSTRTRNLLAGAPRELRRQLEYKARRYGSQVVPVGRFYPSSKLCSRCGEKKDDLSSEEIYRCPSCGIVINRDLNAALNIQKEMLRLLDIAD